MIEHRKIPAYYACFRMGMLLVIRNRADLLSKLTIYVVLLIVYYNIFTIMPMEKLAIPNITARHLLWYFAIAEIIIVSVGPLRRDMGEIIASGQFTSLMQRPGSMIGLIMARLIGGYIVQATIVFGLTLCLLPPIGLSLPMPLMLIPVLMLMTLMGGVIALLLGCLVGMFEIFGPYSQPIDWVANKLTMAFGGLFFPVCLFPPLVKQIVMATPFPAIFYVPGQLMLGATHTTIAEGILLQLFWLVVLGSLVVIFQKKLVHRVMRTGD